MSRYSCFSKAPLMLIYPHSTYCKSHIRIILTGRQCHDVCIIINIYICIHIASYSSASISHKNPTLKSIAVL